MPIASKIALFTPVLAHHDAVGNDVLGMYEALLAPGREVRLFADTVVGTKLRVYRSEELPAFCNDADSCLLYHFSVGWERGLKIVEAAAGRKAVKYHNVTPPAFYVPYSGDYAAVCQAGRAEIERIARMPFDLFLGDSSYNVGELVAAGAPAERAGVVPPFHQVADLIEVAADLAFLDRFRDGFNVLMVGRIAPNKGHPALVRAFADFQKMHRRDARLIVIGRHDARLAGYDAQIHAAIRAEGIAEQVFLMGGVGLPQLKAAYLCADAFMIMSEHEGFCVPVVEAMALGVPLVGLGAAAVPETVGAAGLLWGGDDRLFFSESLREIADDPGLRHALGEMGRVRFEETFREDRIRSVFLKEMERVPAHEYA